MDHDFGQREMEDCSLSDFRLDPSPSTVVLNDTLGDREAYASLFADAADPVTGIEQVIGPIVSWRATAIEFHGGDVAPQDAVATLPLSSPLASHKPPRSL